MTTDTSAPPASGFRTFGLDPRLLKGIEAAGFTEPRSIQQKTIGAALTGRDVLGLAQTGTGKTAAFLLPLLSRLLASEPPALSKPRSGRAPRPIRVLVLAPTRELANQIEAELILLARFTALKSTAIFGGISQARQVRALRAGVDVVVACPGRLLDLLGQREIDLSGVESLVLDEADQMFDMGFLPSIRKILTALPKRRQSLLFSATMPREIRRLADDLLKTPQVVELASTAPAETIEHALYPVSEESKLDLLLYLLAQPTTSSAIVFTRTKHKAKRLAERLMRQGHAAVSLQGNLSQAQRDKAMAGFREGRHKVLVATDIASRGLDVEHISHVINFDIPISSEAYTHRIGRTGRSGRKGLACTFVTRDDRDQVKDIERGLRQTLPVVRIEPAALSAFVAKLPAPAPEPKRAPVAQGRGAGGSGRRAVGGRGAGRGAQSGPQTRQSNTSGPSKPGQASGERGRTRSEGSTGPAQAKRGESRVAKSSQSLPAPRRGAGRVASGAQRSNARS